VFGTDESPGGFQLVYGTVILYEPCISGLCIGCMTVGSSAVYYGRCPSVFASLTAVYGTDESPGGVQLVYGTVILHESCISGLVEAL
jgi:hypothetical protein